MFQFIHQFVSVHSSELQKVFKNEDANYKVLYLFRKYKIVSSNKIENVIKVGILLISGLILACKGWNFNRNPSNSLLNPIENVIQFVVNVNNLEVNCVDSPDYVLNALPWNIKLCKSSFVDSNNITHNVVNASLVSPFDVYASKWSCKAAAVFELFPKNNKNDEIIVKNITKQNFSSGNPSYGIDELIDWNIFLEKYVMNNEAKFEIRISTDFPYRRVETEQTSVKFYVFAKNVTKSIFTSPDVIVRGIKWNVSTGKEGDNLAIYLHANENDLDQNESMEVSASFTLLSMDESFDQEPHRFTRVFGKKYNINRGFPDLISWDKFIEPKNKLIENDMAMFLIELSVGEPRLNWNTSE